MNINFNEVLRYMGYRQSMSIDEHLYKEIDDSIKEMEKVVEPSAIAQFFSLELLEENHIRIADMDMYSESLYHHLSGCTGVYLIAVTIGIGVDRLIKRAQLTSMSKATMYQAIGAAMAEEVCDTLNEELRVKELANNRYLKTRYSPGYGGLPLSHQEDFERLIHMSDIGIHLTESYLMIPSKSVTAIIGVTDEPQRNHSDCRNCDMKDCYMRREDNDNS